MREWDGPKVAAAIGRNLTEISRLTEDLWWEAMASYRDRDMPGGRALNILAPAARMQDWDAQYAELEAELTRRTDHGLDQQLSDEHPVNVLSYWSGRVREDRDQPTSLTPTLSRESDYLRENLPWITRTDQITKEPAWPEVSQLAKDLRILRCSMEDVAHVGDRLDHSAATCFQLDAEANRCGGDLVRVNLKRRPCPHVRLLAEHYVDHPGQLGTAMVILMRWFPHLAEEHKTCDQGGRDDVYRCLTCEKRYTPSEYWLCVREGYEKAARA